MPCFMTEKTLLVKYRVPEPKTGNFLRNRQNVLKAFFYKIPRGKPQVNITDHCFVVAFNAFYVIYSWNYVVTTCMSVDRLLSKKQPIAYSSSIGFFTAVCFYQSTPLTPSPSRTRPDTWAAHTRYQNWRRRPGGSALCTYRPAVHQNRSDKSQYLPYGRNLRRSFALWLDCSSWRTRGWIRLVL